MMEEKEITQLRLRILEITTRYLIANLEPHQLACFANQVKKDEEYMRIGKKLNEAIGWEL